MTFPSRRLRPQAVLALVRRDYRIIRSYRFALMLDLVLGAINLFVYYFISQTFEGVGSENLGGAPSYFAFAAVGIAVTVVIQAASAGLAHKIREEQLTGTLEALIAQPVGTVELALGLAGFPFVFAMARVAFYLFVAVAVLGLDVDHASWVGFVVVLLAAGAALATMGIILGGLVLVLKRGEVLAGLVTFGMGLVSGAFFPVTVLPDLVQPLGAIVPTRFAFDGLRAALFRGEGWAGDATALAVFAVVGLPIAFAGFRSALHLAQRRGSLAQY